MNTPHQNARLTRHSREQVAACLASGQTAAEVAAAFAVSVRTVRKWRARFRAVGGAAPTGARPFRPSKPCVRSRRCRSSKLDRSMRRRRQASARLPSCGAGSGWPSRCRETLLTASRGRRVLAADDRRTTRSPFRETAGKEWQADIPTASGRNARWPTRRPHGRGGRPSDPRAPRPSRPSDPRPSPITPGGRPVRPRDDRRADQAPRRQTPR